MSVYWLDLFTPSNWEEARIRGFKVTRFRRQRWPVVSRIKQGDFFVCYVTKLGRFSGILKALSSPYRDETITEETRDESIFPSVVDVEPIVAFDFLHSVPTASIISKLSIAQKWGGLIRGCPVRIPPEDGKLITNILLKSEKNGIEYPIMQKTMAGEEERSLLASRFGEPLNFKGLKYAPMNKEGVVYLFALMARDLGFSVVAIGSSFPECEAKRRMDMQGGIWEKVRMQFEYRSSDFKDHGHDTDRCDAIVCWEDNWKSCPLEVIELSSTLRKLDSKTAPAAE